MNERTIYIDIDNTLVFWEKDVFHGLDLPERKCVVNQDAEDITLFVWICIGKGKTKKFADRYYKLGKINIRLLDNLLWWKNNGFNFVFWSGNGSSWVKTVLKTVDCFYNEFEYSNKGLRIKQIFQESPKLTKPAFYIDDTDVSVWCKGRKDPKEI